MYKDSSILCGLGVDFEQNVELGVAETASFLLLYSYSTYSCSLTSLWTFPEPLSSHIIWAYQSLPSLLHFASTHFSEFPPSYALRLLMPPSRVPIQIDVSFLGEMWQ